MFLAVIAGAELAGILGVLFAIPALAVLRVVFDFLGARLRMVDRREDGPGARAPETSPSVVRGG